MTIEEAIKNLTAYMYFEFDELPKDVGIAISDGIIGKHPPEKLAVLNSLEIVEFSCCDGECEYVLVDKSIEHICDLANAGFSTGQISEAIDDDLIDIALLAFGYAGAAWYDSSVGFTKEAPNEQND